MSLEQQASMFATGVGQSFVLAFYGLIIAGIGYFMYMFLRYNLPVQIFERTKNDIKLVHTDTARKVNDKETGVVYYELKKSKKKILPPEGDDGVYIKQGGFGKAKEFLILTLTPQGNYYHTPYKNPEFRFEVMPAQVSYWQAWQHKYTDQIYKEKENFWEKYGHYVVFLGTLAIITVILITLFNKFEHLDKLAGALNNVAESSKAIAKPNFGG